MKTGGTTARLLVAAAVGHFRCPATRAASSRMPSGLAIAGDLGVAERPLRAGQLAWLYGRSSEAGPFIRSSARCALNLSPSTGAMTLRPKKEVRRMPACFDSTRLDGTARVSYALRQRCHRRAPVTATKMREAA